MTVVVEAAERSGSLITAEVAADLGRDVGAVPGPVTSWRSAGTNALLHDGAALVRDADDVLDVGARRRAGRARDRPGRAALEPRLASLLRARRRRPRHARGAARRRRTRRSARSPALTELELLGRLRRVAGGRYVVVPRW